MARQRLIDACQSPPAFSQSAWLVIVESDLPLPDGLADGDVGEPDEEPDDGGVDIEPLLEPDPPVAPVLPLPPVLLPVPPAPLLPVPPAPLLEPAAPEPLPLPPPV